MGQETINVAVVLALLHTGFNLLMTTVFGLFPKPILWLVRNLIPGEGIRGYRTPLVTTSGMDAPELQVLEAQREAERHHELALKMIREMRGLLDELDPAKRDAVGGRIQEYWSLGARYESEMKIFLERLARNKLSGDTYRRVQFLLEWTSDMGQMAELCNRFRILQMEREMGDVYFVPKQRARLIAMLDGIAEAMAALGELNMPLEVSISHSDVYIGKLESHLIEVDAMREQMRTKHREDIRKGRYSLESGLAFSEMGDLLEEMSLRVGLLSTKFTEIFRA
jgi:Na+/phosphate symporter